MDFLKIPLLAAPEDKDTDDKARSSQTIPGFIRPPNAYLVFTGWFSFFMWIFSILEYLFTNTSTVTEEKLKYLQIPSIFCHALYFSSIFIWKYYGKTSSSSIIPMSFVSSLLVMCIYIYSIIPGNGLNYPLVLVDWVRTGIYSLASVMLGYIFFFEWNFYDVRRD